MRLSVGACEFGPLRHASRRVLSWAAACLLALVGWTSATSCFAQEGVVADAPDAAKPTYERPVLIPLEGEIGPMLEHYIYRRLDAAKKHGADLIIFEIDSPGGRLIETLNMAKRLRATDWAHTVAYVPRGSEAISGAAVFSLGCDDILMHPEAQMGDAGAVYRAPDGTIIQAKEKIASYAKQIRDLAEQTGRSPALAEAMMDSDLLVYKATNKRTGDVRFVSKLEAKRLQQDADGDDWIVDEIPVEESKEGRFLMVNGSRAAELQLARQTVDNFDEVKELYGLEEEPVTLGPRWTDTMAYVLNLGFVTFLLILVGLICLYIEFSAPGIGVGAILAVICFMLFFWSRFLGGTADVLDLLLFLGGLACLAVELFVLPGFGVFGLSGVLLIFASLLLAGQTFIIPSNAIEFEEFTSSAGVLAGSLVAFGVAAVYLSRNFGTLPMLSKLSIQPPSAPLKASNVVQEDADEDRGETAALVAGSVGKAHTALRPFGKARFGEQYVNVHVEDDIVSPGTPIEVVAVDGDDVLVRRIVDVD